MSAAVALRPRAEPVLEVLAAWRVLPGALMVLGRAPGPVPASGTVQAAGARGVFRALSWSGDDDADGCSFLAAVRLPERADPADGTSLLLRGAASFTLGLPPASVADAAFGQMAARLAGPHGAAVARFMLDTLRPPGDRDVPRTGTMLRAFLSQAAQPDGHTEIMAFVPEGCVLLQGWGARVTGPVQVILAGAALPCFAGHAGEFARADTAAPATGVMLALPPAAFEALHGLDHVFILSDAGLHSRTVLEHRLLDPAASVGHIRHMLPSLRCPPSMGAMLGEALRPRYDGRDTLGGNPHPVRAAVDVSVGAPGVGAYLSGWVFDPAGLIAALHLCGTGDLAVRLDVEWTRVPRPDVSDAFKAEPGFPPPPNADAGFAVFTPAAFAANEALYLQFTFTDGDRAFLPVSLADPAIAAVRARLLASVDLYKPSGLPIIERHAAPLMARVRPAPAAPARVMVAGPVERAHVIVVPLPAPALPRAFLSGFLQDPLAGTEQVVLVCGPEWDRTGLDALHGLLRFYALPATVLLASSAGPVAALVEAARATAAESFLLAGPGVSGRVPGWRQTLRRAAAGQDFACPTLLYEDWSIRYAGSTRLRFGDAAPWTEAHAPLLGLPAGLAGADAPSPATIGTLECCVLRRTALAALDGDGALATEAGREAAFFMRLRAAGLSGLWVPTVQAYAPETVDAPNRAGRLVDGWVLRDAWRGQEG